MVTYHGTTSSNTTENNGKNSCDSSGGIDFCPFQLTPPINEYTYCVLKRICRKIVKEICYEQRKEVYCIFDGGKSLGYQPIEKTKSKGFTDHAFSTSSSKHHQPSSSSPQSTFLKTNNPTKQSIEHTIRIKNTDNSQDMKKPISINNLRRGFAKKKNILELAQGNNELPIILNLRQKVRHMRVSSLMSTEIQPPKDQNIRNPVSQEMRAKQDDTHVRDLRPEERKANEAQALLNQLNKINISKNDLASKNKTTQKDSFNKNVISQERKDNNANLPFKGTTTKDTSTSKKFSASIPAVNNSLNNRRPIRESAYPLQNIKKSYPITGPRDVIENSRSRQISRNKTKEDTDIRVENKIKGLSRNEKNIYNKTSFQNKKSQSSNRTAKPNNIKFQRTLIEKRSRQYEVISHQLNDNERRVQSKHAVRNDNQKHSRPSSKPFAGLRRRPPSTKATSDAIRTCDFLRAQMENRELCSPSLCPSKPTALPLEGSFAIKNCVKSNCRCQQYSIKCLSSI